MKKGKKDLKKSEKIISYSLIFLVVIIAISLLFFMKPTGKVVDENNTSVNESMNSSIENLTGEDNKSGYLNNENIFEGSDLSNNESSNESGDEKSYGVMDVLIPGDIYTCGNITQSGTYTLSANVNSSGACINITVNNVVLDGNGYKLIFNTGENLRTPGISINSGLTNITIKNLNLTYGGTSVEIDTIGILTGNLSNSTFSNNTIQVLAGDFTGGSNAVVFSGNCSNINISNNRINALAGRAIQFSFSSTASIIKYNVLSSVDDGVDFFGSADANNISDNNISVPVKFYAYAISNLISNNNLTSSSGGDCLSFYGIFSNNSIFNNYINNLGTNDGLHILSSGAVSSYNYVFNNTFNRANYGIFSDALINSDIISNNRFSIISSKDLRFTNTGVLSLIDQQIRNYTFVKLSNITIENSTFGKIVFVNMNGTGTNLYGNSSSDIFIGNNSVYVNSSKLGLNKSANVTLYNIPMNFISPTILRDGVVCPSFICSIYMSLNSGNVTFNVNSWSNYSIAEGPLIPGNIYNCGNITQSGTYTLSANVSSNGVCFTISSDNVTLNGNGNILNFNTGAGNNVYGILITGTRDNITLNNFAIINDSGAGSGSSIRGIYANSNLSNININNNTIRIYSNSASWGIYINGNSQYNLLTSNNITSNSLGIYISGPSLNNTLTNNIINSSYYGIRFAYLSSFSNLTNNTIITSYSSHSNGDAILYDSPSSNNILRGNNITSTNNGIYFYDSSSNNTLINNNINSYSIGVYLWGLSSDNILTGNNITSTNHNGIAYVYSSTGNILTSNNINSGAGYYDVDFSFSNNLSWANNLSLINQIVSKYNIVGLSNITFINTNYGKISLFNINGTGNNLSSDIQIGNNSVYVNDSNSGLNKSANVTIYNLPTNFINPKIIRDGLYECNITTVPTCSNFTSLNASNVSFNVSSWSNYSIMGTIATASNNESITLNSGWNLVSFGSNINSTGDKNISVHSGWNLIGYSGNNSILVDNINFTNVTTRTSFSRAYVNGQIRPYFTYFDSSPSLALNRKYRLSSVSYSRIDTSYLNKTKGYFLYSNVAGNLTIYNVSGAIGNETFNYSSLRVTNGSMQLNLSEAGNASYNWINSSIYYYGCDSRFFYNNCGTEGAIYEFLRVPDYKTNISSYEGVFVYSNKDNITLIR